MRVQQSTAWSIKGRGGILQGSKSVRQRPRTIQGTCKCLSEGTVSTREGKERIGPRCLIRRDGMACAVQAHRDATRRVRQPKQANRKQHRHAARHPAAYVRVSSGGRVRSAYCARGAAQKHNNSHVLHKYSEMRPGPQDKCSFQIGLFVPML